MTVSAYLSLLDDWDLLAPALRSVADRVDEIIVVDGAYAWMRPYFDKAGRDPSCSLPKVYDVLAEFGGKIRVINGIWENELEKRIAGYSACAGRYRYRVDADEIFFFDEPAVARFFTSGAAVGQMEMPVYVAPGLISGRAGENIPRQSFLFDSDRISAHEHLSYLWLVLPEWERRKFGDPIQELIFGEPLAFNAHLTHWRPPSSALARARFYIMNYMRQFGGPGRTPITDFTAFFEQTSPAAFDEILLGKPLTVIPSEDQFSCRKSPLTGAQDQQFAYLHGRFLDSLAALNAGLAHGWRSTQRGENYHLDATLPDSLPLARPGNVLAVQYSDAIAAIKVELSSFFSTAERNTKATLDVQWNGDIGIFSLPDLPPDAGFLRRVLTLAVWTHNGAPVVQFRFAPVAGKGTGHAAAQL
jgi:hypothetical protein